MKVPSLLVRGSGKAADLIADAVILKNSEADPGNVEQKQMWSVLQKFDIEKYKPKHHDQKEYDYAKVISGMRH